MKRKIILAVSLICCIIWLILVLQGRLSWWLGIILLIIVCYSGKDFLLKDKHS